MKEMDRNGDNFIIITGPCDCCEHRHDHDHKHCHDCPNRPDDSGDFDDNCECPCSTSRLRSIHQFYRREKCSDKLLPVYPVSYMQAIYDGVTGATLEAVIGCFNYIFLPFRGTAECTRMLVPDKYRRESLIISYKNFKDETVIEQYIGKCIADEEWVRDDNWQAPFKEGNFIVNVDDETLNQIINNWLEEGGVIDIILQQLTETIKNFFNSEEGKEIVRDIIKELVEELLDQYFTEIRQALLDNERVTANALARHEMAITEIQNQLLSQGISLNTDMMIPYNVEQYNDGEDADDEITD